MKTAILVLVLALCSISVADRLNKNPLWNGMPDYPLDSAAFRLEYAPNAGNCKVEICDGGKPTAWMYAYYEDGPRILICMCPDSFMNITGMAYRQGQVPLAVRSSVSTITAGSKDKGGGAWTIFNDIAYFGDFVPNVFLHESGHALDFAQGNMYGSMGLSDSKEWRDSIAQSSCVPDPYAQTNEAEDWAQMTVARYWAKALNKDISSSEVSCMTPQLKYAVSALPEKYQFPPKKAYVISAYKSSKVLTTANSATDDNSPLSVETYTRSKNQIWKIMPTAYDWYIACETNSWKCLDNQRDDGEGKNAIITYRTAFISSQHRFVSLGNNLYKLIHRTSGLALSSGCQGRDSSPVYLKDNGNDCQKWLIQSADRSNNNTCANSVGSILRSSGGTPSINVNSNTYLTSPDCNFRLVLQPDGNLVLYDKSNKVYWAINSSASGNSKLVMQDDGNLVVYTDQNRAYWWTGTNGNGKGPFTLNVDNGGFFYIQDSTGSRTWSSK